MIVVFGSINIDLIGHAPKLMKPGETVLGTSLEFAPGGKGANQALAASRAGADVRMIGCVGNDEFATRALALLNAAEIDLSHVRRMDRHTGTALIIVDEAGENMITVLPGANNRLTVSALEAARIGADDTLLLQLETPIEGVTKAALKARAAGARVVLNMAPFAQVSRDLLEATSVLVVNEGELAGVLEMLGKGDLDAEAGVAWLSSQFSNTVVATLGAGGALAASSKETVSVPALRITPRDTVGAGDTFVGYLAAALDSESTLEAALRRAAVAAGLACTKAGAQPSIPEYWEVEPRLSELE